MVVGPLSGSVTSHHFLQKPQWDEYVNIIDLTSSSTMVEGGYILNELSGKVECCGG